VLARLREKIRIFEPFATVEDARPLEVIADQNMLTEYRYGESIFR
jgi:hypothetical protein